MMKSMPAVIKPKVKNETAFSTKPTPSFSIKEVPSKRLVIQIGLTLSIKSAAKPNVSTMIRDDLRLAFNSSRLVISGIS